jgi:putative transcriptional regulator
MKKYKSDAFEAIHQSALALARIGVINDHELASFDADCLSIQPTRIEPQQIKQIREENKLTQSVFAQYLNTSLSTLQKWESGIKKPSGTALKLLFVVQKHGIDVLA